ncbi:MAG: prolyl oligopeptidase family serine peptidase [Solirubrobacteraceae bacterium]
MRCLPVALACLLTAAVAAVPAGAEPNLPPGVSAPVLRSPVPAGAGTNVALPGRHDGPRKVDGDASDWAGSLPGFGGAAMYSGGELVYQDHLFDAYGADEGQDAARAAIYDQGVSFLPQLYRVDATALQYAPGELGVPTGPFISRTEHGGLPHQDQADLSEVRLGTGKKGALWLLARTTTMTDPAAALLVLLDTQPGDTERSVPFNSGLKTIPGDVALLITAAGGKLADLSTGAITDLPAGAVAYDPTGYGNTIEARIPAAALQGATQPQIAVAAGLADGADKLRALGDAESNPKGVNVANVAFRPNEPPREWWDRQQALELYEGSMDAFFTAADLNRMAAGASERYVPGPGYHEAIFTSTPEISEESEDKGLLQRYGVYLPEGYDDSRPTPTQFWLHFRGGTAHVAAHVVPGVFSDMGEEHDSIVITPHGRGTSGWYVGKSGVDIEQVWKDTHRRFAIDRNRTYVAGHSMGGYGSWLLPVMHPDWFAGSFPASPPATQGAWTGADFEGCDEYTVDEYSPCFIQANGGDARAQLTYPLLDNLREVPYVVYHGAEDELVPTTGVTVMTNKLQDLGYRFRYYLFHGQEHYGPPAVDQWVEGANYLHRFVRNPNPAQVTYVRSMVFENAIERVNSGGAAIDFALDKAYWMRGLEPVDPAEGVARFDGSSLALPKVPHSTFPEADGGAKTGNGSPFTMVGQAWRADPAATPATSNAFTATLTGARAVRLGLARMKLSTSKALTGTVQADGPLALTLAGVRGPVGVTIDGAPVTTTRAGAALTINAPAGEHTVVVSPR